MTTQNYGWLGGQNWAPEQIGYIGCSGIGVSGFGTVFTYESGHAGINSIQYYVQSVAGSPTFQFSLQNVLSRTSISGILSSGTAFVNVVISGTGFGVATLPFVYSGNQGDVIAATCQYLSGNTSATIVNDTFAATINSPYSTSVMSGVWSVDTNGGATLAPTYSDGFVPKGIMCAAPFVNAPSLSNASNPRYIGTAWTQQLGAVITGVQAAFRPNTGSNFVVSLYEGTNTTPVVQSSTFNPDIMMNRIGNVQPCIIPIPSYTLKAGNTYRLVVSMTTATGFTTWNTITFPTVGAMTAVNGPFYYTQSASPVTGGSWADNTLKSINFYPIFDSISSPAIVTPVPSYGIIA